jgi:hypothetical protein
VRRRIVNGSMPLAAKHLRGYVACHGQAYRDESGQHFYKNSMLPTVNHTPHLKPINLRFNLCSV